MRNRGIIFDDFPIKNIAHINHCQIVEKLNTKSGHFFIMGVDILLSIVLHSPTKEKILFNYGNFFL